MMTGNTEYIGVRMCFLRALINRRTSKASDVLLNLIIVIGPGGERSRPNTVISHPFPYGRSGGASVWSREWQKRVFLDCFVLR
jgi:hypothetical protein